MFLKGLDWRSIW